jgi:hypothetical protein
MVGLMYKVVNNKRYSNASAAERDSRGRRTGAGIGTSAKAPMASLV